MYSSSYKPEPHIIILPSASTLESRLQFCEENNKIPAVILTTGSFCPVHKGHIYSLLDSRDFIESNFNYKIIAIYASPSNDDYVANKAIRHSFFRFFLKFEQRCKLFEQTIEIMAKNKEFEEDFIFLDRWEGNQVEFIDFPEVWNTINGSFQEKFKKYKGFKVFYSLGSDMIARMSIDIHRPKGMPLLVTERVLDKTPPKIKKYQKWLAEKNFASMEDENLYYGLPSKDYGNFSSTLLRDCIEKDEKMIEELVFPEVAKSIKKFYEENNEENKKKGCGTLIKKILG